MFTGTNLGIGVFIKLKKNRKHSTYKQNTNAGVMQEELGLVKDDMHQQRQELVQLIQKQGTGTTSHVVLALYYYPEPAK